MGGALDFPVGGHRAPRFVIQYRVCAILEPIDAVNPDIDAGAGELEAMRRFQFRYEKWCAPRLDLTEAADQALGPPQLARDGGAPQFQQTRGIRCG
ncbi:MAG: hypothetical protein WDM77_11125 [Steroidobacteraceae bacterium]